jgi:tetratricopeptide (TPR) repeat protein
MNTAARLQTAAPVDGVLVGEATYRATERTIVYEEVGAVEAKGKAQPVPAWRAVEPRSRFGIDFEQTGGAPLVGRQRELDLLLGALARAREERSVQLVTVVGVPGIGKSRLVWELSQVVDQDPDELVYWRQGRSLSYGEGVSFWALGETVKAHAGILETDAVDVARDKLRNVLAEAVADAEEARWIEEHLSTLVGLGDVEATGDRRDEAFAAWRRFFEALADVSPLVLVFEDLQWADDGLLDFVDHLVEWARDVPMLVVCTARPELLARRPGWGGGKPNAATLSLPPLADEEIARLLSALLDQPLLSADTQSRLLAQAGGNPLYTEEYVRMLAEAGPVELELPETVQGIIAARLDVLDPAEKLLLQDAAVIGKVVWVGALATVGGREPRETEKLLHALERREFVRRERRSSVAGEGEYAFRHILVRDVAYGQIPRARRAELHERAATWLESLAADRTEDRAEMLGHHYLAALEFAQAAGSPSSELVERARIPLRQAGDRAYALNAFETAIRFYEAALAHWPVDDSARAEVLLAYGRALLVGRDAGEEAIGEAVTALLADGRVELAAEGEVMLGELEWRNARREEGRRHLDRAERLIEGLPPTRATAYVLAQLARFEMLAHGGEPAIARGQLALTAADALGLDLLRLHALVTIGTARTIVGDPKGFDDLEEAIEVGTPLNTPEVLRAYINLASVTSDLGRLEEAHRLHEEGMRVARRFGASASIQWLEAEIAVDLYWAGRWDEAFRRADAFLAEWPNHYMESAARIVRAAVWMGRGRTDEALAEAAAGLRHSRGAQDPQNLWPTLGFNAFMLLTAGRRDEAVETADELLGTIRAADEALPPSWVIYLGLALEDLGRLDDIAELVSRVSFPSPFLDLLTALAAGDLVGAADRLGEAGWRSEEAMVRLRAGGRLLTAGRHAEGEAQLARALDFFRSVRATAYLQEAEHVLARSA